MGKSAAGKGSDRRPRQVEYDEFAKNWDNIFSKSKKKQQETKDNNINESIHTTQERLQG